MRRAICTPLVFLAVITAGVAVARTPVVVEVYTAQGCASCDRSNAYVAALADRPGIAALTFDVDYWDYLGWKDTFAQPEFSARQQSFDKRFGLHDVYTPQIIVDGQAQASGDKQTDVEALIAGARRESDQDPKIIPRADGTIAVASAGHRRHTDDVWLVRYDPRPQSVVVREGDNRGQTVTHRNVVRQLVRLGAWNGSRRIFRPPSPPEDGLDSMVIVQGRDGGAIVAALRIRSKS